MLEEIRSKGTLPDGVRDLLRARALGAPLEPDLLIPVLGPAVAADLAALDELVEAARAEGLLTADSLVDLAGLVPSGIDGSRVGAATTGSATAWISRARARSFGVIPFSLQVWRATRTRL
jgi:hypothetical protein